MDLTEHKVNENNNFKDMFPDAKGYYYTQSKDNLIGYTLGGQGMGAVWGYKIFYKDTKVILWMQEDYDCYDENGNLDNNHAINLYFFQTLIEPNDHKFLDTEIKEIYELAGHVLKMKHRRFKKITINHPSPLKVGFTDRKYGKSIA